MTRVFSCNSIASYIYVHNDIDQVLARQAVVKINLPDCREEPASNKVLNLIFDVAITSVISLPVS